MFALNKNIHVQNSAFDKAINISKGSNSVAFKYGIGRSRYERVDNTNGEQTITHYGPGSERIERINGANPGVEIKRYVGDLLITHYQNTGAETTQLMIKDHLGSVVGIANSSGQLQTRYRFDAFGLQHQINNGLLARVTTRTDHTQRGFTGHEMLGSMDIIHMNG